jgi:multidrug efflux system outer membrane protein
MRPLSPLLISLLVAGCAVGPDYEKPQFPHQEQWQSREAASSELTLSSELAETDEKAWWQQFDDPVLNDLIAMAAESNKEIKGALARIEQARALRGSVSSSYWPQLDSSAGASRTKYSSQGNFGSGIRNNYSASLDASWELDLFGRIRRSVEATDARIDAEVASRDGLLLSVLAETATAYFELRSLQAQLANSERTIELLKEVEAIAQAQLDAGTISEIDLLRARGERQNLQSQLPNMQADITARIHRISVLTGKPPEYHIALLAAHAALPEPKDRVPLGLRSGLLERRPDIRMAERELAAATADIGVAKAALFPDFSLTGTIGSTARMFGDLFATGTITHSVGSALNWPIFAAGKYMSLVDAAEAGKRAALADYEQAVLLALEDTENALFRYGQEWKTLTQLKEVVSSREQAFEIARLRYEAGEESFLSLIDAERTLNDARVNLIFSQQRLLTRLAALYKALGGRW